MILRVEALGARAYPLAAELLRDRAGLVFAPSRRSAVETALGRVMQQSGVLDPELFARKLAEQGALFDELMALVTVGETYFFREPAQFALLRETVFPALTGRDPGTPLRLWSAACASGEEAYSLAITALESGVAARVIGTDISHTRLDVARRGHYRDWSLRGVPPETVAKHFTSDSRGHTLRPEIRRRVEFHQLNLMTPVERTGGPAGTSGTLPRDVDVIFCRNVFIYFDREAVAAVAARLLARLRPDGWLLLGASDPMIGDLVPCTVESTPAGLAYRPGTGQSRAFPSPWSVLSVPATPDSQEPGDAPAASRIDTHAVPAATDATDATDATSHAADPAPILAPAPASPSSSPSPSPSPLERARAAFAGRDYRTAAETASRALDAGARDLGLFVLLVRALANEGDLPLADRWCLRAIEHHQDAAELHYLHAMLLLHTGHAGPAAAAARRATYLRRDYAPAALVLADAQSREGDTGAACDTLRRVIRMLDRRSAPREGADTGTAGAAMASGMVLDVEDEERPERMLAIARARLATLTASTPHRA